MTDADSGASDQVMPPSNNSPDEDPHADRKKAVRELVIVGGVLFLIFVVFLPQFIDYGQVIDAMLTLTIGQIILLTILGVAFTWFSAGVYTVLIPGLGWWDGWKAWASSNSVAFVAPPGADLAIRFGMYRTAGITGEAAGAGIVLSWFFTTGYKLVVPIVALVWVIVAEGIEDAAVVTLAIIGLAGVIGASALTFMILYRERIALRIGEVAERWYNSLAGGRWKFPEGEGLGLKLVDFRGQVIGTVKSRWFPATVVTLTAQAIFFIMLLLSMRFMDVTAEHASAAIIFDAYAIGLLLSMIPIFPGGLGVVELAYVGVIVGNAQNSELAAAVTAGAFVHRVFSWLVPIIVGLFPLAAWRRAMVDEEGSEAAGGEG